MYVIYNFCFFYCHAHGKPLKFFQRDCRFTSAVSVFSRRLICVTLIILHLFWFRNS